MNSRELMHAAIEGRKVDRIPIAPFFWGADYSWKLIDRPVWEVFHGPVELGLEMVKAVDSRHGCDWVRNLHHPSGHLTDKKLIKEDRSACYFIDESTKEEWIFHKDGHWLGRVGEEKPAMSGHINSEPPKSREEADAILGGPPPPKDTSPIRADMTLREMFPDRFLTADMPCPFAGLGYTIGFESMLFLLTDDPSLCSYMLERMIGDVERQAKSLAARGCDAGMMTDSWASADIISPVVYKNWVAPHHKRIADALHAEGLKAIMYNTGNVLPMLDSMVACGYDAYAPEERCKGVEMDIAEIRRTVGPDVCLFGNFDSYLLLDGDRDRIRSEVGRHMKTAKEGRFVMGTGSPICDGTEPEVIDFWISLVREKD